ncbi:MAG: sigma-54 dependent transcriptional regulator [Acidobacteriia bacterium]|nr:sigma-54 dependent transcriptional regulator [Terriglobia bacterium]
MEWDQQKAPELALGGLIGVSAGLQRVFSLLRSVSSHSYPLLILGESGTGKEAAARVIHSLGQHKDKPFVTIDCGSLAPALIESVLFGYERSAFTEASQVKPGLLYAADHGTILLDEIDELPSYLQAKLLRVFQEEEFRPISSTHHKSLNARIIAATHRDLIAQVKAGSFREDLYFRLNVVQINMPPLRERKTDIPLLVDFFIGKHTEGESQIEFSEAALKHLFAYDWPGNVRELENAVRRGLALASGPKVEVADLGLDFCEDALNRNEPLPLNEFERSAILSALHETQGDKISAARVLGIGKSTLYRRLKYYGFW